MDFWKPRGRIFPQVSFHWTKTYVFEVLIYQPSSILPGIKIQYIDYDVLFFRVFFLTLRDSGKMW